MALTNKQQIFIDEYLKCWNATEAARRAGYQGSENTIANIGFQNLRKVEIKEVIDQRMRESAMSADEVLMRLAMHARSNLADFSHVENSNDLKKMNGEAIVAKKFRKRIDKDGNEIIELELYDAQSALALLGKRHKLFTDRVEHSGEIGVKGYVNISPDDWDEG